LGEDRKILPLPLRLGGSQRTEEVTVTEQQVRYAVEEMEAVLQVLEEKGWDVDRVLGYPKSEWAVEAEGRGC
jgi:hypothetical protein